MFNSLFPHRVRRLGIEWKQNNEKWKLYKNPHLISLDLRSSNAPQDLQRLFPRLRFVDIHDEELRESDIRQLEAHLPKDVVVHFQHSRCLTGLSAEQMKHFGRFKEVRLPPVRMQDFADHLGKLTSLRALTVWLWNTKDVLNLSSGSGSVEQLVLFVNTDVLHPFSDVDWPRDEMAIQSIGASLNASWKALRLLIIYVGKGDEVGLRFRDCLLKGLKESKARIMVIFR